MAAYGKNSVHSSRPLVLPFRAWDLVDAAVAVDDATVGAEAALAMEAV